MSFARETTSRLLLHMPRDLAALVAEYARPSDSEKIYMWIAGGVCPDHGVCRHIVLHSMAIVLHSMAIPHDCATVRFSLDDRGDVVIKRGTRQMEHHIPLSTLDRFMRGIEIPVGMYFATAYGSFNMMHLRDKLAAELAEL